MVSWRQWHLSTVALLRRMQPETTCSTVQAGQEVTRDHLPRGPRSLQRGAALLCLLDRPQLWAHAAEFEGYKAGLQRVMERQQPPGVGQALPRRSPADTRVRPKVSAQAIRAARLSAICGQGWLPPEVDFVCFSKCRRMVPPSESSSLCREGMHEGWG